MILLIQCWQALIQRIKLLPHLLSVCFGSSTRLYSLDDASVQVQKALSYVAHDVNLESIETRFLHLFA